MMIKNFKEFFFWPMLVTRQKPSFSTNFSVGNHLLYSCDHGVSPGWYYREIPDASERVDSLLDISLIKVKASGAIWMYIKIMNKLSKIH